MAKVILTVAVEYEEGSEYMEPNDVRAAAERAFESLYNWPDIISVEVELPDEAE